MEKISVYIDFEEVSSPFNRDLKYGFFPYAYTIGINIDKKFKTKTTIVNFEKVKLKHLYPFLRERINLDIASLLNLDGFIVSRTTIRFKAFGSDLERRVISRLFQGVQIIEINKGKQISLEKATEREMGKKDYFPLLKKAVNEILEDSFIERRGLNKDGALAALAGYMLYLNANKNLAQHYKYEVPICSKDLIKEVTEYSKDDVLRMKVIVDNYELFFTKYEKRKLLLANIRKKTKELNAKKAVIKILSKEDKNLAIGPYLDKLKKELSNLDKEINEMKTKNQNEVL